MSRWTFGTRELDFFRSPVFLMMLASLVTCVVVEVGLLTEVLNFVDEVRAGPVLHLRGLLRTTL